MKKLYQKVSIVVLALAMVVLSAVPAFAGSSKYYENHSTVDCTNRYKTDDGKFNFTIKIPKDSKLSDTDIAITENYNGDILFRTSLEKFSSNLAYSYSDNTSDYYILLIDKYVDAGVGIKLFCYYYYNNSGIIHTATNEANGTATEGGTGRGYWLDA